tara:strand:+ start:450 stop:887 length:438 start_codon:yes stop_codon:yes gene_type:complete
MNSYDKWKQLEDDANDVNARRDRAIATNGNDGINYEYTFIPEFIPVPELPDVASQRKATPVFSGVLAYFPDAINDIAKCSLVCQQQHNPNKPLAWDRSKSGDELDALSRHLLDAGTLDTDGIRHSAKVAWRALANLQKEIERDGK